MPACCGCATGSCGTRRCACVKDDKKCTDCAPLSTGSCDNAAAAKSGTASSPSTPSPKTSTAAKVIVDPPSPSSLQANAAKPTTPKGKAKTKCSCGGKCANSRCDCVKEGGKCTLARCQCDPEKCENHDRKGKTASAPATPTTSQPSTPKAKKAAAKPSPATPANNEHRRDDDGKKEDKGHSTTTAEDPVSVATAKRGRSGAVVPVGLPGTPPPSVAPAPLKPKKEAVPLSPSRDKEACCSCVKTLCGTKHCPCKREAHLCTGCNLKDNCKNRGTSAEDVAQNPHSPSPSASKTDTSEKKPVNASAILDSDPRVLNARQSAITATQLDAAGSPDRALEHYDTTVRLLEEVLTDHSKEAAFGALQVLHTTYLVRAGEIRSGANSSQASSSLDKAKHPEVSAWTVVPPGTPSKAPVIVASVSVAPACLDASLTPRPETSGGPSTPTKGADTPFGVQVKFGVNKLARVFGIKDGWFMKQKPAQVTLFAASPASQDQQDRGWLQKKGDDVLGLWRTRWFRLLPAENCLAYFKDSNEVKECGRIPLDDFAVTAVKDNFFVITVGTRHYQLWSEQSDDCSLWVETLSRLRGRKAHLPAGVTIPQPDHPSNEEDGSTRPQTTEDQPPGSPVTDASSSTDNAPSDSAPSASDATPLGSFDQTKPAGSPPKAKPKTSPKKPSAAGKPGKVPSVYAQQQSRRDEMLLVLERTPSRFGKRLFAGTDRFKVLSVCRSTGRGANAGKWIYRYQHLSREDRGVKTIDTSLPMTEPGDVTKTWEFNEKDQAEWFHLSHVQAALKMAKKSTDQLGTAMTRWTVNVIYYAICRTEDGDKNLGYVGKAKNGIMDRWLTQKSCHCQHAQEMMAGHAHLLDRRQFVDVMLALRGVENFLLIPVAQSDSTETLRQLEESLIESTGVRGPAGMNISR